MTTNTTFSIEIIISIITAIIIIMTFRANTKKINTDEAEHKGRADEKLDYIFQGISDIKEDNKNINKALIDISKRITLAEYNIELDKKNIDEIKKASIDLQEAMYGQYKKNVSS